MKYLVVDDEPLALEDFEQALEEAAPGGDVRSFAAPSKALEYCRMNLVDVAFLDIELGSMNGLIFAEKLKTFQPKVHIIFVTSYEQYAVGAFQIHASGYLMKPVTPEDICRELTFLYKEEKGRRIRVQTFGGFDVFVEDRPLRFKRLKSKELLAYLIDKRGNSVTCGEACAVLWEDGISSSGQKSYFRTVLADLRSTLREAGAEEVLIKSYNRIAIDPGKLDCDSYQFLNGDPRAVSSYRHDYMSCYSWAEFCIGAFEKF